MDIDRAMARVRALGTARDRVRDQQCRRQEHVHALRGAAAAGAVRLEIRAPALSDRPRGGTGTLGAHPSAEAVKRAIERPRDDIPLAPFAHGPAYVLSRDAGYRGKVALADLMA